jgi:uncharacterized protein (TIGR01777 family)
MRQVIGGGGTKPARIRALYRYYSGTSLPRESKSLWGCLEPATLSAMARVLVSGASGLIGFALASSLESRGCEVTKLVRRSPRDAHETKWSPMRPIPPELVSGFDAVIHLSGENIAGRWTDAKKQRIRDTRIVSTDNLSQALAKAGKPPRTFICASAIGYYGTRGDEILFEESLSGDGFFPEVCRQWEYATEPASDAGIRTINLRTGLVLSRDGGALKQMLLPFRLGLGGKVGDGCQWWSWIHIEDLLRAVLHILQSATVTEQRVSSPARIKGPVNVVSPNPVTNAEFTKSLAKALNRPAVLPIPAVAAKLVLGELADETLLASARVQARKLIESGFEFRFPELATALKHLLQ